MLCNAKVMVIHTQLRCQVSELPVTVNKLVKLM